jgi:hypothetical protein
MQPKGRRKLTDRLSDAATVLWKAGELSPECYLKQLALTNAYRRARYSEMRIMSEFAADAPQAELTLTELTLTELKLKPQPTKGD